MKVKQVIAKVVFLVVVIALAGCAGVYFNAGNVNKLKPGVSTATEAVSLLGKPYSQSSYQDGTRLYQWMFVSPLGARHVAIKFDAKNTMIMVTHRTGF